ncbi:MAG: glycosyltransferase [Novosphingobium sp.]
MSDGVLAGRRIGLLTASASRLGGGVAEAVVAQAAIIRGLGGEAPVFALADAFADQARTALAPSSLALATVLGPRQIGFAPGQRRQLLEGGLDLLHLHGIWMHTSRIGQQWASATGRPFLISPHGMLDPWITARGRWKKALARFGWERAAWKAADGFHALTPGEGRDIAREAGREGAWVIPNAAPAVEVQPARARPLDVLYLGRIHPKKNLAGLIEGWRRASLPSGARLTIAGWGAEADVAALRGHLEAAPDPSIAFVGPAYGRDKQRLLSEARFLVLASFSEGLPMVILEAWAAGTPTITSEGCNLPEGPAAGASLTSGTAPVDVAAAITTALALSAGEWQAMSGAAQALAAGPFGTAQVTRRWGEAYAAMLGS